MQNSGKSSNAQGKTRCGGMRVADKPYRNMASVVEKPKVQQFYRASSLLHAWA